MSADPIARFVALFEKAKATEPNDATAMTLATVDARGRPAARVVLLKGVDARGFVFFTNRESRKGHDLAARPFAALCILWPTSQQQVRVEGRVEQVSDAESDAYFATRPRESQIGAWASHQSQPLATREELEARAVALGERYPETVPRPPHWGGYRVVPERIELWFAGKGRLHDRFSYEKDPGDPSGRAGGMGVSPIETGWTMTRLNP
jgi:pyridoxamine 5'-phosphate oxidase